VVIFVDSDESTGDEALVEQAAKIKTMATSVLRIKQPA
jgi:hypothetical protein